MEWPMEQERAERMHASLPSRRVWPYRAGSLRHVRERQINRQSDSSWLISGRYGVLIDEYQLTYQPMVLSESAKLSRDSIVLIANRPDFVPYLHLYRQPEVTKAVDELLAKDSISRVVVINVDQYTMNNRATTSTVHVLTELLCDRDAFRIRFFAGRSLGSIKQCCQFFCTNRSVSLLG